MYHIRHEPAFFCCSLVKSKPTCLPWGTQIQSQQTNKTTTTKQPHKLSNIFNINIAKNTPLPPQTNFCRNLDRLKQMKHADENVLFKKKNFLASLHFRSSFHLLVLIALLKIDFKLMIFLSVVLYKITFIVFLETAEDNWHFFDWAINVMFMTFFNQRRSSEVS